MKLFEIVGHQLKENADGPKSEVYHGSKTPEIRKFEYRNGIRTILFHSEERMSNGFFFALNIKDAQFYGKYVSAYKIALNKPLLGNSGIKNTKHAEDIGYVIEGLFKKEDDEWMKFEGLMKTFYIQTDPTKRDPDWIYDFIRAEPIHKGKDLLAGRMGIDWEVLDNPECVRRMKSKGYDGTLVFEENLSAHLSWFVISPNQIHFLHSVT